jgi:hypothetical protein
MSYTQRDADWVIQKAYLAAQRKAVPPASSTTKYAVLLGQLDSAQDDWRNEADTEWESLYQTVANGTVTATDTFDLDDEIDFISKREGDYITLSKDGVVQTVELVAPNQLYSAQNVLAAARIGRTLKFSKAFGSSSSYLGYTLNIPAYIFTDDITSGSDLIQCDDPMFLAYMLAAEFVRTDVVKGGQYNNLLDKAAERMARMKQNNGGQNNEIPRTALAMGETWN